VGIIQGVNTLCGSFAEFFFKMLKQMVRIVTTVL
jgi:hypothetical protein